MKNEEVFKETMKSFEPEYADCDTLPAIAGVVKKHGLGIKIKDGKVPEEFSTVTKWFLNAFTAVNSLNHSKSLLNRLEEQNNKLNTTYLERLAFSSAIKDIENRVNALLEAIDLSEKTGKKLRRLRQNESFELDILKAELFNCEAILKKCRGLKEITMDDTPVSILVDSLFVSQCYSPDPKIIEYKKYTEDSFLEFKAQRVVPISTNTLENTFSEASELKKTDEKEKSKKKCCGLISRCK